MFPNLRLIIGATIATIALVMIMGSGLFSFRDPYRKLDDVPDMGRPLVQHAIAEHREEQQMRMLASVRRSGELQRLLDLPVSPVRAYAPEPPAAFPFVLKPPAGDAAQAMQEAAATLTGDTTTPDANPLNAPPAQAVAALPPPAVPEAAEEPAVPSLAGPPEAPQPVAPAAANVPAATPAAPADMTATDREAATVPDQTASVPATAVATSDGVVSDVSSDVPASAVPAVALAPLPRANPRVGRGGDESAERPVVRHGIRRTIRHARSRRIVQIARTLPGWDRRPATAQLPAQPLAQTQPQPLGPLPTPFESNVFGRTGIGSH